MKGPVWNLAARMCLPCRLRLHGRLKALGHRLGQRTVRSREVLLCNGRSGPSPTVNYQAVMAFLAGSGSCSGPCSGLVMHVLVIQDHYRLDIDTRRSVARTIFFQSLDRWKARTGSWPTSVYTPPLNWCRILSNGRMAGVQQQVRARAEAAERALAAVAPTGSSPRPYAEGAHGDERGAGRRLCCIKRLSLPCTFVFLFWNGCPFNQQHGCPLFEGNRCCGTECGLELRKCSLRATLEVNSFGFRAGLQKLTSCTTFVLKSYGFRAQDSRSVLCVLLVC